MPNEPFRAFGDTTVAVMQHEFRRLNSPLLPHAAELHRILSPHTNLAMAFLAIEQIYWTYHEVIPKYFNNPWSISISASGGVHTWRQYPSVAEAARDWRARILDPAGPYGNARTVEDLVYIYAPPFENDTAKYIARVYDYKTAYQEIAAKLGDTGGGTDPLNFDPARCPMPPYSRRLISKPDGHGASYAGKRYPLYGALHRMQGTLWGTDTYFRLPGTAALTDWGIGHQTGELIQWCDPYGDLSGWASGPVSSPYGDGKAFIDWARAKYGGGDNVNRFGVSLEFSGYFKQPGSSVQQDSPLSQAAMLVAAKWLAHYAQVNKIPWHQFPMRAEGFSFVIWHQEFTIGTGKICPGKVIMDATPEIIALARDILKAAQTGGVVIEPPPPPDPKPEIVYPIGLNQELAERLFGKLVAPTGAVYAFDPSGPVSRAWLDEGAKDGEFGQLTEIMTVDAKPYFRFSDGLILYQASGTGAYRPLGVGDPTPAGADTPK